jgi:hypothetical protein
MCKNNPILRNTVLAEVIAEVFYVCVSCQYSGTDGIQLALVNESECMRYLSYYSLCSYDVSQGNEWTLECDDMLCVNGDVLS